MVRRLNDEPIAKHLSRLPPGYVFVPKGNVFVTGKVRRLTNETGKVLWRVQNDKGQDIGLRCPSEIYELVLDLEAATRADREENVIKKDLRDSAKARAALLRLFPQIPKADIEKVMKRAFEKASGRVGRTTLISLDDRVAMAVWAHIRHAHTSYDTVLGRRRGDVPPATNKEEVRRDIRPTVERIFLLWGGTKKLMQSSGLAYAKSKDGKNGAHGKRRVKVTTAKTTGIYITKGKAKEVKFTRQNRSSPRGKPRKHVL